MRRSETTQSWKRGATEQKKRGAELERYKRRWNLR